MARKSTTAAPSVTELTWDAKLAFLIDCGAIPKAVHRVLLYGSYGVGKSSAVLRHYGNDCERIAIDPSTCREDLLGSLSLVSDGKGGTSTQWADGPVTRAMRLGRPVVIDEIDRAAPELESTLHAILDDHSIAGVTLSNGERVTPAPGYCVFATSNAHPEDLTRGIRDRLVEMRLLCDRPAAGIIDSLPAGFATVLERQYQQDAGVYNWQTPDITVRSILAVTRLSQALGSTEDAAKLVFGPTVGEELMCSVAAAVA